MLHINRQTDYAIRVILNLAKNPPGTRKPTAEIRDEMLIPPALSQRIVAELARGNFILTFPGRDGGIQLARPAGQINLLQVIEFIQGPIEVSECLISGGEECSCSFGTACPVRKRWIRLRTLIRSELESQTFDLLAQDSEEGKAFLYVS
ncbi:MAG: RrF2 family transcriptional regulator [Chloroflexota bacterium]